MTDFDFEMVELELSEALDKVISYLKINLAKVRTGKADAGVLDNIKFDYFGDMTPLTQMAQISSPEPRQLVIKPYDMTAINSMVKAIKDADLGIYPANEGERIRMTFPPLTEETRRSMVKNIGKYGEEAKISIRKVRQSYMGMVKNSGETEDAIERMQSNVQEYIVNYNNQVDELIKWKEKQVMTI